MKRFFQVVIFSLIVSLGNTISSNAEIIELQCQINSQTIDRNISKSPNKSTAIIKIIKGKESIKELYPNITLKYDQNIHIIIQTSDGFDENFLNNYQYNSVSSQIINTDDSYNASKSINIPPIEENTSLTISRMTGLINVVRIYIRTLKGEFLLDQYKAFGKCEIAEKLEKKF